MDYILIIMEDKLIIPQSFPTFDVFIFKISLHSKGTLIRKSMSMTPFLNYISLGGLYKQQ